MKEVIGESLKSTLNALSLPLFIDRLSGSRYPFAWWRLPGAEKSQILIDLSGNQDKKKTLEEMDSCFIINPYHESHPPHPTILEGDVVIEIEDGKQSIRFSPKISSNQIEDFVHEMNTINGSWQTNQPLPPSGSDPSFKDKAAQAIRFIQQGNALKIVLSRYEDYQLPDSFRLADCFHQIKDAYPNAFCYLLSSRTHGTWIGASPEQLVSIENHKIFRTESLAGTQLRPEHGGLGDVAWTQKEIEEQAMVSRYIINCLKKIRLREFEESGPKTVQAGQLVHLKTEFKVDMEATNTPDLGSIMLDLLHPTSAVCGMPHEAARQYIEEHEGYERELYAGFIGPVNFNQNTHLFVNLRCMKLFDKTARLYAGAGITADSNPEKEWMETVHKMRTLSDILR